LTGTSRVGRLVTTSTLASVFRTNFSEALGELMLVDAPLPPPIIGSLRELHMTQLRFGYIWGKTETTPPPGVDMAPH
jgi:hypothetical protein